MATNLQASESHGYEKTDASPRGLIYFAAAVAAILAITAAVMVSVFQHYQRTETAGSYVARPFEAVTVPPPPRIQPDPRVDMRSYAESQEKLLNTYGWIDRQNGIVRLPIDRAMELLLERGLPTRSGSGQEKTAASDGPEQKPQRAASEGAEP
jgi:hypothetical protein